jgi:DNA mismatch repair protein MutL
MGFRGEALPSIASVSRFTLTTRERERDSPEGTQVIVNGGKIVEVKAAGRAPGTTVEVRQLFFNLPARRKFLRAEETESAHIQHYLTLAALAFPEVAFTFQKDGRTVWQLPAEKSGPEPAARFPALRDRLRALYGPDQKLLQLEFSGTVTPANPSEGPEDSVAEIGRGTLFRLWGFIGAPGVSRSTRSDQHLFVNRRPIENRGLNFALLEGYHTALMKGRYPVCCLFIEVDPSAVDVNIHPAKREVRFHREAEIRRLVAQAIRQCLLEFHSNRGERPAEMRGERGEVRRGDNELTTEVSEQVVTQPALPEFQRGSAPPVTPTRPPAQQPVLKMGFATQQSERRDAWDVSVPPRPTPTASDPPPSPRPSDLTPPSAPAALLHVPLRLVGVIGRLYVVLESDRGLVLLDQHAAHERILFEQMLNRLEEKRQAPSQKLLLPETVEVSARDADFLRQQLPALTRLGVGLSEFGERTFLLDALPPFVKVSDARRFVLELVDELKAAGQEVNSARLGEHTVAKTVCRHAVKANDPLAGRELENLVEDLRRCTMPYTCPHGRPTLIEMNFRELEKKFGRSQ